MFSITVVTYNEEDVIADDIASILAQEGLGPDDRINIIENGSRDRTPEIVHEIAATDPRITAYNLALGDKANAWDMQVFRLAPRDPNAIHVFMDGDVQMRPGSLLAIRDTFAANPDAMAVAGLPYGGRRADAWRERMLANHGLTGNLYALADSTLERIRQEGWHLPVGCIGDDTFLVWFLKRRLDPAAEPDMTAIVPAEGAGFDYESIPTNTTDGLGKLYRRHRKYALRDLQNWLLLQHLARDPANRPPKDIEELYPAARPWTGLKGPFGRITPLVHPRKALFLNAWAKARWGRPRTDPAWYET